MTTHSQRLVRIARDTLSIPTLETRRSDHLDFHTVSVWGIASALQAAFAEGVRAAAMAERLDELLESVMDSDDPPFTTEQVAYLHDRIDEITTTISTTPSGA